MSDPNVSFLGLALFLGCLCAGPMAMAASKDDGWRISGTVIDIRFTLPGTKSTNTLSVDGVRQNSLFLVEVDPTKTEDETAETAGWDGQKLRLIKRYPETPGKGLSRDRAIAYIEPSIFSRYATHPTTGLLLALADSNSLKYLQALKEPVILGEQRIYPEEQNKYDVKISQDGSVSITALSPGRAITPTGEDPIPGFEGGFTRWVFVSELVPSAIQGNFQILFEYKRFFPEKGKLFLYRHVLGDLKLNAEEKTRSDFRPEIYEPSLFVRDHSSRRELHPFIKGLTDYLFGYTLTNRAWDFDETIVSREVKNVQQALLAKGLPDEIASRSRSGNTNSGTRRLVTVTALFTFSLAFAAGLLWLARCKTKGRKST